MNDAYSALIQTAADAWLGFGAPLRVVTARAPADVAPALAAIESEVAAGRHAAGYLAYEAAGGLDAALRTHAHPAYPLVWFGIYDSVRHLRELPAPTGSFAVGPWEPSITRAAYASAIVRVREYLQAGDTYQVNYTMRLRAPLQGDPYALFAGLARAQRSTCCAYVDAGSHVICSASPELFFERAGRIVRSRPMKGTAARGLTWAEDQALADALRASRKDQAENVMIVDMIRNDLGRVADAGTVRVSRLYDVERFPTVLQMTSTVEAETDAPFSRLMHALFPCASITGAPKARTMEIIRELEPDPRGVYTGAIGYVAPDGRMRFNVAIRTVVLDRRTGAAEYGVGGGITWDSTDANEYAECLRKAAVLTRRVPDFDLLETLRWSPDEGFALLDRHMTRLARTAAYFDIALREDDVRGALQRAVAGLPRAPHRIRLTVDRSSLPAVTAAPLAITPTAAPLRVAVAPVAVDESDPFLYHKTTNRAVYDEARQARPDCDDVILVNRAGQVTESTIANVVVEIGGRSLTPPLRCGLLAGTMREELLSRGELSEAVLTPADLRAADHLHLINSVRGWIPVRLID